ncbi:MULTISPECIES: TrkH family potassium uptake protein [Bacillus]|uniref:TrkH family potassium uptake protein n=1 Tax=Bacillus TaxID=1386 RepID=UPI00031DC2B8|nr:MULTISPECIES: potassium transporter TrkG [Bacillus]
MLLTKSTIKSFRSIFLIYITVIFIFGFLYLLPFARVDSLSIIDSLFVSTSALSVTGLSTINVADELTRWGQALLIFEMQLGGIGILVLISYLFLMMGKRMTMSSMILISRDQNQTNLKTIKSLSFSVLIIALLIETIAFLMMYGQIEPYYSSTKDAVFITTFHVVASFTNAGFDLFDGGFSSFQHNPIVLLTTSATIFLGSIGYPTIIEYIFSFKKRKSLFTKINIRLHFILLCFGTIIYFFLEYKGAFDKLSLIDKFSNAVFLSATSRNGGLSTIDLSTITITTVLIISLLMFIGGASSSTGGGIRLTTFAVLIAKMISVAKSQEHTVIYKKTISQETINKSFLIFISFILFIFTSTVILTLFEKAPIEQISFEVISALTNTGLSMGITDQLAAVSKCILICLMVIGRIGIFTLIYFVFRVESSKVKYLKEDIAVG